MCNSALLLALSGLHEWKVPLGKTIPLQEILRKEAGHAWGEVSWWRRTP